MRNAYFKAVVLITFLTAGYGIGAAFLKFLPSVLMKGATAQNEGDSPAGDFPTVESIYVKDQIKFLGTTSGAVNVSAAAVAGNWTMLLPTTAGIASQFLQTDGAGITTWATPAVSVLGTDHRTLVTLGSDQTNSNAVANTLEDVTGLSFSATSGTTYRFRAVIAWTPNASTTGSRWTINGPTTTLLAYTSRYSNSGSAVSWAINYASAYQTPTASEINSVASGSIAEITGILTPSATGTVIVQHASELANSTITAKAGSTLEWW